MGAATCAAADPAAAAEERRKQQRYDEIMAEVLEEEILRPGHKALVFTGIATNVCVESTLRDAYFREFFCILIDDATQQAGPPFIQDATVYNVETFLGWVTGTAEFCRAVEDR